MKDTVKQFVMRFVREEEGQDLVEYTLLLAFVCLASAALFINAGSTMANIWTIANTTLKNAQDAAS
jgi:Flp pilus assembly pilin Flp